MNLLAFPNMYVFLLTKCPLVNFIGWRSSLADLGQNLDGGGGGVGANLTNFSPAAPFSKNIYLLSMNYIIGHFFVF